MFTVRLLNVPGVLASPDKIADHILCISESEVSRALSKKFVNLGLPRFRGHGVEQI